MKKIIAIATILIFVVLVTIYIAIRPYYLFLTNTLLISPSKTIFSNDELERFDNQVNILLLGIAGPDHDGPNLSDSIMVFNYNLTRNKLNMISVPRDIWSSTLRDKINSAYAYGEAKKPNSGGFTLAKSEISSVIGLPIHYAASIDFNRFKELIDFLGGVEVDVQRSFTDNKFPIKGMENDECDNDPEYKCRYETISFSKGKTTMNGEQALKFVRSRNSVGDEGTDFARESRQQEVFEAVKNKIIEFSMRPDVKNYEKLYNLLNNVIKRDIKNQQLAIILKNVILKKSPATTKISLEKVFTNPKISERYDYKWVLIPRTGSFDYIHSYILCEIEERKNCYKEKDIKE